MVRHIVFFKLKENNRNNNIIKLKEALNSLGEKIDVVRHIEVGENFTVKESAFDISLIVDFDSKLDFETYRVHPEHKKVVDLILEINEKSAVVDYEF